MLDSPILIHFHYIEKSGQNHLLPHQLYDLSKDKIGTNMRRSECEREIVDLS